MLWPLTGHAQTVERATATTWWGAIVTQVTEVITLAITTLDRVFDGDALLVAQVGSTLDDEELPTAPTPPSIPPGLLAGDVPGQIVINTPLVVDNVLTVTQPVSFATTTLTGPLEATTGTFSGVVSASGLTTGFMTVGSGASIGGALAAAGGITTGGTDIDLEGGQLFASNVVNEVVAGDNVTITGTLNRPVISLDESAIDRVESLNGQDGALVLRGDDDIEISGLTIRNESDLRSVRGRGGCSGCVTDTDVANTLTLSGGSINGVVIGGTTAAAAYFTDTFIGTSTATATLTIAGTLSTTEAISVAASATSTIAGGLNVTGGCVAVNGVCIGGATNLNGLSDVNTTGAATGSILQYDGASWVTATTAIGIDTFLELTDTPSVFATSSIVFVNASGSALTQDSNLVFTGGNLGVGTSSPLERLSVGGNVGLLARSAMRFYDTDNSGYVGFRASSSVTGSTVWTLPATDGGADQVLVTDGAGNLSFTDLSSLGIVQSYTDLDDTPNSLVASAIAFASSTGTAMTQSSLFVYTAAGNLGVGTSTPMERLSIMGNAGLFGGGATRFYTASNNNYIALQASSTLSSDVDLYLPINVGAVDQVLVTDGAGNLRFDDVSALGTSVRNYVELLDTPSSLTAYSIPFASSTGSELSQSSDLVYRNGNLGIGTNNPGETLVVDGSVRFTSPSNGGDTGFMYTESLDRVGVGTANPSSKLTVVGGSFSQAAGDSSNVTTPSVLNTDSLAGTINEFKVAGKYAYAVTDATGNDFHVIDMSNLSNPAEIASLNLPTNANAVDVLGQYAFVVTDLASNEFYVFDISDPTAPSQVAALNLTTSATDIAVAGQYAYVTLSSVNDNFVVVDISDVVRPTVATTTSLGVGLNTVAINGAVAYLGSDVTGDDFHVMDISDPLAPVEIDSIALDDEVNDIAFVGQYAYVGSNSSGDDLHIINIASSTNVSETNSIALNTGVRGVEVVGSYLYTVGLAGVNNFNVFSIASPASPVAIARDTYGTLNDVQVVGNRAYVAAAALTTVDTTGVNAQSIVSGSLVSNTMTVSDSASVIGRLSVYENIFALAGVEVTDTLMVRGTGISSVAGELTIGTTTAATSSLLTVAGSITATNLLGGVTGLSTDANGQIIRDPSDARLKTNVTDIENALDILLELRGVRYQWVDPERFGYQTEVGFIAQEVYEVLPEVVRQGGDYWSLNTQNILAIVVEAMQDIWAEIQGNSQRITVLEERLDAIASSSASHPAPTPPVVNETPDSTTEPVQQSDEGSSDTTATTTGDETPPVQSPATTSTSTTATTSLVTSSGSTTASVDPATSTPVTVTTSATSSGASAGTTAGDETGNTTQSAADSDPAPAVTSLPPSEDKATTTEQIDDSPVPPAPLVVTASPSQATSSRSD